MRKELMNELKEIRERLDRLEEGRGKPSDRWRECLSYLTDIDPDVWDSSDIIRWVNEWLINGGLSDAERDECEFLSDEDLFGSRFD